MSKDLLIVFVKNIILGKVKTRLAKTIGDVGAFKIYSELFSITEEESKKVEAKRHIYFSDVIIPSKWENDQKFVQKGENLGMRMQNAFQQGFDEGYENIILIGSDLPDISKEVIEKGFKNLKNNELVFGPADDGGYYLIGMSKMNSSVFKDKPWSKSTLLDVTLQEISKQQRSVFLLETLNDIDTFEDLVNSNFYKTSILAQEIVKQQNTSIDK
ncbi:TIGR04282 family arsenosugar biosynthesis glycosyltransferase [Pseudotenacibaculum sp. MALMAid0570]|uniref:TIGR04282 family arsenosugar biosynthesis glycosyltransferase n=1 Tax=Pseudotenacibaculum sp. MALMAid0570 TaxID=3143938 RepID=UPI0032DF91A3